jgi:hypothetical protein
MWSETLICERHWWTFCVISPWRWVKMARMLFDQIQIPSEATSRRQPRSFSPRSNQNPYAIFMLAHTFVESIRRHCLSSASFPFNKESIAGDLSHAWSVAQLPRSQIHLRQAPSEPPPAKWKEHCQKHFVQFYSAWHATRRHERPFIVFLARERK